MVGGTVETCTFSYLLEIDFDVRAAEKYYSHGWGNNSFAAKPIVCSWDLFVIGSHGKPTVLKCNLIQGITALITGLDVPRYAKIDNNQHRLLFKRPTDKSKRFFSTYIANDAGNNKRACILLLPNYTVSQ